MNVWFPAPGSIYSFHFADRMPQDGSAYAGILASFSGAKKKPRSPCRMAENVAMLLLIEFVMIPIYASGSASQGVCLPGAFFFEEKAKRTCGTLGTVVAIWYMKKDRAMNNPNNAAAVAPFTADINGGMKDADGDRVITCHRNEGIPPCSLFKEPLVDNDAQFICPECGCLGRFMEEASQRQCRFRPQIGPSTGVSHSESALHTKNH